VDAARARRFDFGDALVDLAPVAFAGGFVMRELHANLRAFANRQRFVHRLEQPIAFVADVAGVHAAPFGGDATQRDEFLGLGER